MTIITIQCSLVAEEETRRHLWELMTQKNTPLINKLLEQMGKRPDREGWIQKGDLPKGLVDFGGSSATIYRANIT